MIRNYIILFLSIWSLTLSAKDYKASLFGAKSDGITLNTNSIQKGIDFISENGGGRLVFYVGRYLTGTFQLKSNVILQLEEGAVLVGTSSVYDYFGINGNSALILGDGQQNIGITGKGVIDGQGGAVRENIESQIKKGYLRSSGNLYPSLIFLKSCSGVTLSQLNMMNAGGSIQTYNDCKDINFNNLTIVNKVSKDSEGMDFSGCGDVKVSASYFDTSGAEIVVKNKTGNISVTDCKNSSGRKLSVQK